MKPLSWYNWLFLIVISLAALWFALDATAARKGRSEEFGTKPAPCVVFARRGKRVVICKGEIVPQPFPQQVR